MYFKCNLYHQKRNRFSFPLFQPSKTGENTANYKNPTGSHWKNYG